MSTKKSSANTNKKPPTKRVAIASNSKLDTNSSGGKVIIGGLPPKKPFEVNERGGPSAEEQCRKDEHVQEASANRSAGPQVALRLTHRFTRAVDYARQLHIECRKGTQVPYMAHLLGVAALVIGENGHVSFPVTEDVVIAALLHDAMEDHGGSPRLENIRANFGSEVARMVEGCSDSTSEDPAEKVCWEQRKKDYLARLRNEQLDTQLISAADKLHNARAMLDDYRRVGPDLWKRFKRGRDQQLWNFNELLKTYSSSGSNRIVEELLRVVRELSQVSENDPHSTEGRKQSREVLLSGTTGPPSAG